MLLAGEIAQNGLVAPESVLDHIDNGVVLYVPDTLSHLEDLVAPDLTHKRQRNAHGRNAVRTLRFDDALRVDGAAHLKLQRCVDFPQFIPDGFRVIRRIVGQLPYQVSRN